MPCSSQQIPSMFQEFLALQPYRLQQLLTMVELHGDSFSIIEKMNSDKTHATNIIILDLSVWLLLSFIFLTFSLICFV